MCSANALSLKDSVEVILWQLGIIRTYKGYAYLAEAVKCAYNDIEVDKFLYKAIAEKYNTKRQSVYNDIRICIKRAQRVNPTFFATLIDSPTDYHLPFLRDFILSIVLWLKEHDAFLIFFDKSTIGKIEWIEKCDRSPFLNPYQNKPKKQ
jgi:hypothetical protein